MADEKEINVADYKKNLETMFPGIGQFFTDDKAKKIVDRLNACPNPGFGDIKHALRENAVVRDEPIEHIMVEWFSAIISNTVMFEAEPEPHQPEADQAGIIHINKSVRSV